METLASIIEALPVPAVVALDPKLTALRVNAAYRTLTGYDAPGVDGTPETLPPLDAIPIRFVSNGRLLGYDELPLVCAMSGRPLDREPYVVERPDGSQVRVLITAWAIHGDDGALAGGIAVYQDVTESVQTAQFLRELARLSPALIFTTDAAGRLDFINDRWSELFGVPVDEMRRDGWARFIHPDDAVAALAAWTAARDAGSRFAMEWRLLRGDGTYRWIEIRAEAERDHAGNVLRWFGSGVDIDARRRAATALKMLAERPVEAAEDESVADVMERMARGAMDGLADLTIFDLLRDDGTYDRVVVAAPDIPDDVLAAVRGLRLPPVEPGTQHPVGRAIFENRLQIVPAVDAAYGSGDALTDGPRRDAWRASGIRSFITAPLPASSGPIGTMSLIRIRSELPFDAADAAVAEEIARRAALAVETVHLAALNKRERAELRIFADLGEALSESLGLQATLEAVMQLAVPRFADWAFITLADDAGDLRVAAVFHADSEKRGLLETTLGTVYARGTNPTGAPEAMRSRLPILYAQATYDDAARVVDPPALDVFTAVGFTSVIVVPLLVGTTARGTLQVAMADSGRRFERNDVAFFNEIGRRIAPGIANAEVFERERRVARSFQQAALPAALPLVPGFTFRAIYEAGSDEAPIGGDWYDALRLIDGRIVVSIGDVAGSGLQAAVTMANVRQTIRGVAQVHADSALMLEAADRALRAEQPDRFVTAFVGVIDPIAATITFAGAGHPAPIVRAPDGTVTHLESHGLPLGLRDHGSSDTRVAALEPGMVIALYTDGLVESTHDIVAGDERLCRVFADSAIALAADPAAALLAGVLDQRSRDDVAILTVAIGPPPAAQRWTFDPCDARAGRAMQRDFHDRLRAGGLADHLADGAELVLAELIGNLVRHAPGEADVVLQWDAGWPPVLHVLDSGPGFTFAAKLPSDVLSESGRGLFLIAALTQDFHVTRRAGTGSHARAVLTT